jgi:hypothetical protein
METTGCLFSVYARMIAGKTFKSSRGFQNISLPRPTLC